MQIQNKFNKFALSLLAALISFGAACQPPAGNSVIGTPTNANANSIMNANIANSNIVNTNIANNSGALIDTKEPDHYQATVSIKFEVAGTNNITTPPIRAEVARNGADRRMEFALPNGEKLIYIDHDGKQFVVSPNRRQYAELTKEAVGFEVRKMLTPEQIVNQVKTLKGVERVGEEKVDGRDALKYRYGATTDTQTKAGTVATESMVLVDKETGLPLRSVTNAQSPNGNVQGVQGLSVVTEINNIRTTADASLFAPPTDMKQVAPEEIKQQVDAVFSAAAAIFGQLMKGMNSAPAATPNQ